MSDNRRYNKNVNSVQLEYHYLANPTNEQITNASSSYVNGYVPLVEEIPSLATVPEIIRVGNAVSSSYHYRLLSSGEPSGVTWTNGTNSFATLYDAGLTNAIPVFASPTASSPAYLRAGNDNDGYKYYQKISGKTDYFELCGKMPSYLKPGEIAINRSNGHERMFLQNNVGGIVEFRDHDSEMGLVRTIVSEAKTEAVTEAISTPSHYGECTTASGTSAKTVTGVVGVSSLETGTAINVNFKNINSASTPTLTVNGLGPSNIYYNGAQITTGDEKTILSGVVALVYNADISNPGWEVISAGIDTRVRQIASSADQNYPILIKDTNGTSTVTSYTKFRGDVTINPYTGNLTVPKINGVVPKLTDTTKITSYTAPTYDTSHISSDYASIIVTNNVAVGNTFDLGINKIDNKLAGLTKEVGDNEATVAQALIDEPRYLAIETTNSINNVITATLVDDRTLELAANSMPLNGTKVDVRFIANGTGKIQLNINDTGAYNIIYKGTTFNTNIIENGMVLSFVFENTSGNGYWRLVGKVEATQTIPTVYNSTITLKGGNSTTNVSFDSFTLNQSSNKTIYVPVMTGAGASSAGQMGLVPKPSSGDNTKFLRGDGTWVANEQYTLPVAANGTLGGIQVGFSTDSVAKKYAVDLNNNNQAYVNVPWTDTTKITTYTAPTYDTSHISSTYSTIISTNIIAVNDSFDSAINKLDKKLAGLTKEVGDNEAVNSQSIEDEPRYYAKDTNSDASSTTKAATLVENRLYTLLNGTKVAVYFQTANTASGLIFLNVNSTGAKPLVYNNTAFDGSLIEAGTTLDLVYDTSSITIGEPPGPTSAYTGFYRVVGGVGSGGGGSTTQVINVNNPIGNYSVGDTIAIGTNLEQIIRNMLQVVIGVAKQLPTFTYNASVNQNYEVGSTVTPSQTSSEPVDGYYYSADLEKYTKQQFVTNNSSLGVDATTGHLSAGCTLGTVTYPSAQTKTSETSYTFNAQFNYGDGTVWPILSDGSELSHTSSQRITAGTAIASGGTCNWRYKYYYGYTTYQSSGDYSSIFTTKSSLSSLTAGWCSSSTTTLSSMTTPSNKTSMVLVLPLNVGNHTATVTNTTYLSQNVKNNWVAQNVISDYTLPNNTEISYKVLVVHNAAVGLTYTNIQFL